MRFRESDEWMLPCPPDLPRPFSQLLRVLVAHDSGSCVPSLELALIGESCSSRSYPLASTSLCQVTGQCGV